jgi:hypothetical protein
MLASLKHTRRKLRTRQFIACCATRGREGGPRSRLGRSCPLGLCLIANIQYPGLSCYQRLVSENNATVREGQPTFLVGLALGSLSFTLTPIAGLSPIQLLASWYLQGSIHCMFCLIYIVFFANNTRCSTLKPKQCKLAFHLVLLQTRQ